MVFHLDLSTIFSGIHTPAKKKISNGTLVRESPLLERNSGDGQMN
jgi:hypothetical protein